MLADTPLAILVIVFAIVGSIGAFWNSHSFWMLRADIKYFVTSRHTEVRQWFYEIRWWWLGTTRLLEPLVAHLRTWPMFRSEDWRRFYENARQQVYYDRNWWTEGKPPVLPPVYIAPWHMWRPVPYLFLDTKRADALRAIMDPTAGKR